MNDHSDLFDQPPDPAAPAPKQPVADDEVIDFDLLTRRTPKGLVLE